MQSCEHSPGYKHSTGMKRCSYSTLGASSPGRSSFTGEDHAAPMHAGYPCIVRWITSGGAKDVGHEGRADAELMQS